MKTSTFFFVQRIALAFVAIMLVSSSTFGAAPIPGLNIIIKKNPGSIITFNGTSDKAGKFSTKRLAEGTYSIHFSKSTSGDSRKAIENLPPFTLELSPGNKVMVNGKERDSAGNITVNNDTTIEIIIGAKGGTIQGMLMGIQEPGVK